MRGNYTLSVIAVVGCWLVVFFGIPGAAHADSRYLGSAACGNCHQQEYDSWRGSDHANAMARASGKTVLGDFDNAEFTYAGTTSRFFRRNSEFWVNTQGPDGAMTDYKVEYTFGHYPLQQYLVAFPKGHYQVLGIAWDTRSRAEGGQRWFHLYPDQNITFKDPLHWTGPYQKWNSLCADCHVTGWDKNYDSDTGSYNSAWTESGVGCEACHGPGAEHVRRAAEGFGEGRDKVIRSGEFAEQGNWRFAAGASIAHRAEPLKVSRQFQLCATCHSRRTPIDKFLPGDDFLDSYTPDLLSTNLYHIDGQIREEVFVAGSFLQSAMHGAGVVCSNCHNVHSGKIRAGLSGTCLQCHKADTYGTPDHHHHKVGSDGAQCANCHMPETTYMVVDPRRDHSLRIPDPRLSEAVGTPNACNGCHDDKTPAWAADAIDTWRGGESATAAAEQNRVFNRLARIRHNGERSHRAQLQLAVDSGVPGIIRATLLSEFIPRHQREIPSLAAALADPDPLVRMGAARAFSNIPAELRKTPLWPLLNDPVKSVRLEAFRVLSAVPAEQIDASERKAFETARQEYLSAQKVMADTASAWLRIAEIAVNQRDAGAAESAYRKALALEPNLIPAYLNLADLYRATNRDFMARGLLDQALSIAPEDPAAHYAMAMYLFRSKSYDQGLEELKKAIALFPENGRYAYVYAVALADLGRGEEAIAFAEAARTRVDAPVPLLGFLRDSYFRAGETQKAREMQRLLRELAH